MRRTRSRSTRHRRRLRASGSRGLAGAWLSAAGRISGHDGQDVPLAHSSGLSRPNVGSVGRRTEIAGLIALILSALVAVLLDRAPPLEPLAAAIMEWTPVPVANWLLEALGPAGKPLALFGASAMALALAGGLGALTANRRLGSVGPGLAVGLSVLAALPLAEPAAFSTVPGLVAMVGGFWGAYLALGWRVSRQHRVLASPPLLPLSASLPTSASDSRRRALLAMGINATALAFVSGLPVLASALRVRVLGRASRPPPGDGRCSPRARRRPRCRGAACRAPP